MRRPRTFWKNENLICGKSFDSRHLKKKKWRFTKLIRLKLIQLKLIRLKWNRLKWIRSISLRFVSRRYKLIWFQTTTENRISRRRIKASRRTLVSGTEIRFRFRFKIQIRIKVRFPTWNRRRPATPYPKEDSLFSHRTFPTKGKTKVNVRLRKIWAINEKSRCLRIRVLENAIEYLSERTRNYNATFWYFSCFAFNVRILNNKKLFMRCLTVCFIIWSLIVFKRKIKHQTWFWMNKLPSESFGSIQ